MKQYKKLIVHKILYEIKRMSLSDTKLVSFRVFVSIPSLQQVQKKRRVCTYVYRKGSKGSQPPECFRAKFLHDNYDTFFLDIFLLLYRNIQRIFIRIIFVERISQNR